jgi:rod shape-determining protein MreD
MVTFNRAHGLWAVALSFLLAFVLSVISLPDFFPSAFSYGRPEWVAMVLIYWVIATPHRVGITVAWSCGLVVDVLKSSLLGQNALALIVVAYVATGNKVAFACCFPGDHVLALFFCFVIHDG